MPSRTERLQTSSAYKVVLLVLGVVLGAGIWMVIAGVGWPAALVSAVLMIATGFAIGAWFRNRS